MGSGKTTVGRLLAQRSGREFIDNDMQLAAMTDRTAREVQAEEGPDALHALEARALADALDEQRPAVIAAAASVVDDPSLRARLHDRSVVIWLRADVEELADRAHMQAIAHSPRTRHRSSFNSPRLAPAVTASSRTSWWTPANRRPTSSTNCCRRCRIYECSARCTRAYANCSESLRVTVARIDAAKRVARGASTKPNEKIVAIQTERQNGQVTSSPMA